jgi:hypothetical protein
MNAKEFKLDYFQFYDIEIPKDVRELSPLVRLQGQFDQDGPERAKPQYLKKFANPVSKNGEAIFDKNAHLTWYNLTSSDPIVTRKVTVVNQFWERERELRIADVRALLVPAQKRKPRGEFTKPAKLDHYKVYRVIDEQGVDNRAYKLEDQFHNREVTVYRPFAFAVPVTKEIDGKVFPIHNHEAHLTIYEVTRSRDMPNVIDARDQFGVHRYLKMGKSYLLAVPSRKIEWKEEG